MAGYLVTSNDHGGVMAVRTPVCEKLGIDQPIVQAPMAAIPQLAAAVSNTGALGMVTLTLSDDATAVIRETAALTARPFGGNFVLTSDHHRRLDQALEAGLRIVSFMWGIRATTSSLCMPPVASSCTQSARPRKRGGQSHPALTSLSRKAGKLAGTSGAASQHCLWCPLS
jgi:Nitronate monooxygenase